jgi:hypothetical protein
MSTSVADVLVAVLEQIGVKHIFGLIGDSLNPQPEAIHGSRIEWISVRHEGAALAAAGPAKLTGQFAVCASTTALAARIWSRPRARSGAFRRRSAQSCVAPTSSKQPSPIFCSAMSRSISKPSLPRLKHRPSFIRRSRQPTRAVASPKGQPSWI